MADLRFQSKLSKEEIEKNFEELDVFSGIMEGLSEALAYEKGKASAQTFARKQSLPEVNIAKVRSKLRMTQKTFAQVLGVSPRTVEAWECGKTNPTPTAKKLIYLIEQDHSLANKLL